MIIDELDIEILKVFYDIKDRFFTAYSVTKKLYYDKTSRKIIDLSVKIGRKLKKLEKYGLLESESAKNATIYRLNEDCVIFGKNNVKKFIGSLAETGKMLLIKLNLNGIKYIITQTKLV